MDVIDWGAAADLLAGRMVMPTNGTATWTGPGIVMKAPLSDVVRHVMEQSSDDQAHYSIVLPGRAAITLAAIRTLYTRPDFPHAQTRIG